MDVLGVPPFMETTIWVYMWEYVNPIYVMVSGYQNGREY